MNDFLAILSRRALETPTLRPRTPSRFENASPVPAGLAPEAASGAPSPDPVLRPAVTPLVRSEAVVAALAPRVPLQPGAAGAPAAVPHPMPHFMPQFMPELAAERSVPPPQAAPTLSPAPVHAAWPDVAREPLRPRAPASAEAPTAGAAGAREAAVTEPRAGRESPVATLQILNHTVERLLAEPAPHPQPAAPAAAPLAAARTAPAMPAAAPVEIHIGRIEVHAAEQRPAARPPAAPAPAATALDDYLQERSGSRRGGQR